MLVSSARILVRLLLFVNLALAAHFRFGIQEIHVNLTRALRTDELLLAIASNGGATTNSTTWPLGEAKVGATIPGGINLTQVVEVPAKATNLSVAIGLLNKPGGDDGSDLALKFAQGIVNVAAAAPGRAAEPAQILNVVLGVVGSFMNCTGPVALGNAVYAVETLSKLDQGQKSCETNNYLVPTPQITCGTDPSNYTITYCLERLDVDKGDKKSAAPGLFPALGLPALSLAVAFFFGNHGGLM